MNTSTRSALQLKADRPTRHWTLLKGATIASVLGVLIYFAPSAYVADRMTTAVRKPLASTPADYGVTYEPVQFPSAVDNISLKGWFIGTGAGKTIIMLHATDGKRDDPTIGLPDLAMALVQHGYSVLAFDFRGHGESGGTRVSYAALEPRDVSGALNYLKMRGITSAGIIGFSLGAATALNSAAEHPELRVVVSDSAFADLNELMDRELPKEGGVPSLFDPGIELMAWTMFGMDFGNDKPARAVARLGSRPVLLIHGTADDYVLLNHAYELQKAGASDPNLQLWVVPGAEHVRAFKQVPEEYLRRVIGFFDKYLQ